MLPIRVWPLPRRPGAGHAGLRRLFSAQSKAIVYETYGRPLDVLKIHSFPLPDLGPADILVKFLASPINPADINQVEGVYPLKPRFRTTEISSATPLALAGNEGVVEIVDVGPQSRLHHAFNPGDRAIMRHTLFGTWRSFAVAAAQDLTRLPFTTAQISSVQAATASVNPTTALNMLTDFVDLQPGDWFIQTGANSGVGRAAIQIAALRGINSINVVRDRDDIDNLKQDLSSLGATHVVTDKEIADKGFRATIKSWVATAGGKQIKLGLSCTGGDSTTNIARQLSAGGHLVSYGGMARKPVTVPVSLLIFKDIHLHGYWLSRWSDAHPDEKETVVNQIFDWINQGKLKHVPVNTWSWTDDLSDDERLQVFKHAVKTYIDGAHGVKQVLVQT
ncbi:hypothetical protein V1514DRAFT_323229 [Lipomyces japonicus]|uniref:uncharacterized protein n=1 Tax=Lipomyces japonicus TaxID=56871 RepID=UPI0034CFFC94